MPSRTLPIDPYRELFENSIDAVLLTIPGGRIVAANPAACAMFGMTEAELCAAGRDRLVDTTDPAFSTFIEERKRSGKARGELTFRRKDGSTFIGDVSSVILEQRERAFVIIRDITERLQTEEDLRRAHRNLQATIDSITDGLLVLDRDWRYTYFSETGAKMLGMRREDLLGGCVWDLFPHARGTKFYEFYHQAVDTGQPTHFEEFYPEPLNKWLDCHCYPGEEGLAVYFRDITERKQREEELRRAHALLKGIASGTEDMIAAEDGEFRYLFFNEAYRREFKTLWGRDVEVGTSMIEALAPWPEEQRNARELWSRALAGESFRVRMDFGSERERRVYDLHFNPVRDADGRQIGAAHILRNVTEQVRMQQALAESEEHARRIIDNTVALVGIMTPDGTLIEANATALCAGGLRREDVVGKKFWECWWWSYDALVQAQLREAVAKAASGESVRYDVVVRTAGDGRMPIDFMIAPARDSAGRITHLIPSALDLTERKRAEEALRASETTLAAAMESMTDAVFISDLEGRFINFNTAFATYHRFRSKEECARTFAEYPDSLDVFLPDGTLAPVEMWAVPRALRGEIETNAEYTVRRKDSGETWVGSYSFAPVRGQDGEIVGSVVVARDITERKRAEEALRISEERFRVAVKNSMFIPAQTDRELRYRWIYNPHPDFDPFVLIGKRDVEIEDSAGARALQALKQRVLESGRSDREIIEFQRSDGLRIYDFIVEPLLDSAGAVDGVTSVAFDVTERKRAEKALEEAKATAEEASRAKSEFLANMSHEIRTPMTVFMAAIEHLLQTDSNPERRHLLGMADQSARRLRTLIDDILDLSRIESGKIGIKAASFDLRACVREAVEMFALPARERGLRLETEVAAEAPQIVIGDPGRLGQVLINLIGNAVKFTPAGEVRVRVQPRGDRLEFSVADTGIGIPEAKRDLLFQNFTQVDSSFTRKYGGSGLGLAISRGLVELMGGEISVSSREGEGSVFTFAVPLKSAGKQSPPPVEELPKDDGSATTARILLAEDEPMVRQMITMMLAQRGWQAETADTGREAVEKWERGAFDLILMDLQMPEMSGLEATRTIRDREAGRGSRTCIIGLTAHAQREIHEECLKAGMNVVLTKPVQMKDLHAAIGGCLDQFRGHHT